ncbi:MAG: hypothetical protein U5K30_15300 [Acidimicrobiales bacterium]|nr:hypothetical protein [Acidimicrobiales bacterium]
MSNTTTTQAGDGGTNHDMDDQPDRTSAPEVVDTRLERFDQAVADMGHRPSAGDRRWALVGLVAMAAGIGLAIIAYATSTSMSDTRDLMSSGILASVGLCIVVAGAAVFVRASMTEFLRYWLLRVLLQQSEQANDR